MDLLPLEKKAVTLVTAIGQARANRILDSLVHRFDKRCARLWSNNATITIGNVYRTPLEVELSHLLKMGLMLVDNDSPANARQRNLARIAKRNAKRLTRQQSKR